MMQRSSDLVFAFFMAELGTEGSIDGNQRLVIRGKYVPKYIESLLRKYVVEYVTCEMCRSPNTDLKKDGASRLYFCHCRDCGSSRSVAPIRSGYHATSRADRRAARNAKGPFLCPDLNPPSPDFPLTSTFVKPASRNSL